MTGRVLPLALAPKPGSWQARFIGISPRYIAKLWRSARRSVALVAMGSVNGAGKPGRIIAIVGSSDPTDPLHAETMAHAHILKAGPDMLAALRSVLAVRELCFLDLDDDLGEVEFCVACSEKAKTRAEIRHADGCPIGAAVAAIASAEGRS